MYVYNSRDFLNKAIFFPIHSINRLVFINEIQYVFCKVGTEFRLHRVELGIFCDVHFQLRCSVFSVRQVLNF
jgi:hypothetical protein